jgi:hypothetical protein
VSTLSERLLIAALAWGALSFGAVYPWAYWPLAAVSAGIGIHAIIANRAWQDPRIRTLALGLGGIALAIGVQLVALPYSLIEQLSPSLDPFFRDYQLAYHPASVHSLSIASSSTLTVLVLFIAFALLLIGLVSALDRMSLDWTVTQLMGLGIALVVIGLVQKAFPADTANPTVYGFWQPTHGGNPFGPFINRNHYAGWMVMAMPVVAGYACALLAQAERPSARGFAATLRWLARVDSSRFILVGFCALMMGTALVVTGSRSGVASFAVALLVFGLLAMRLSRGGRARVKVALCMIAILAAAVGWAGVDRTVGRFLVARADAPSRMVAWQDTARIIEDFPLVGTGMGTYAQAMMVYQTAGRPRMYAQAHNDYLQIVAEGGGLVAIPVVVAALIVAGGIRRRLRRGDDSATYWVRAGAIAGLAGIAAQSLVEFSLQMPGNTVLFVLLLAIALHRGRGFVIPGARARRSVRSSLDAHRV